LTSGGYNGIIINRYPLRVQRKGGIDVRYNHTNDTVELSVEELCYAAMRGGDLDGGFDKSITPIRAAERAKITERLYELYGLAYHDSVRLHNTVKTEEVYFCVEGVADGILCVNGSYFVDGFGQTNIDAFMPLGLARMYCYAYILCRQKELESVTLRGVSMDGEGELYFSQKKVSIDELRRIYLRLLGSVVWRGTILLDRATVRLPKTAELKFPYKSLRESQAEMIKECYRDIKHSNRLFCQAPTGIGKTVSTLYPSVKCVGEGVADKIFYLTSKQSIRREAVSAMQKLGNSGGMLRTCVISARESVCANGAAKLRGGRLSSNCRGELCPYAAGYYDRMPAALADIMANGDIFDAAAITKYAQKHKVCPYEFSLDLSELCDVIICDYNYVFSPTVYLKRYFSDAQSKDEKYIFLVDEAHNLPARARDMFSKKLDVRAFEHLAQTLPEDCELYRACLDVIEQFWRLHELCRDNMRYFGDGESAGYSVERELPQKLGESLSTFTKKCDSWLSRNSDHPARFIAEDLNFELFEYRKIAERYDGSYLTFINVHGDDVSVLLYCLDPARQLSACLDKACASVMFSATLTPTDYFADILGGGKKSVSVSFASPFEACNLCVTVVDGISTRFEDREASYKKVSSCIAATVSAKSGNYMVFFPSYSYMEQVKEIFCKKYPRVRVLEQKKNMTVSEREAFLSSFAADGKTRIGFCVIGGAFAEGIDLPGDRLIGAVVVGVGLPGISDENNIIRDYYENKNGCGYDYAYTYPGMNAVLQAAGRVIRTESDRGIVVLIDDRLSEPKYRALFPHEWRGAKLVGNARSLAETARRFWESTKQ